MNTIYVDVGRTAIRVGMESPTTRTETTTSRPCDNTTEELSSTAAAVIQAIAAAGITNQPVDTLALGLPALVPDPGALMEVAEQLHATCRSRRVVITDHVVTMCLGSLGWAPGVAINADIGVTVAATNGTTFATVDGWGPTLGGRGGGHDVGTDGFRAVTSFHDGRGGSRILAGVAKRTIGPIEDLPRAMATTEDKIAFVADFATGVATAARLGDDVSIAIWKEAAAHLAEAVTTATDKAFDASAVVPVHFSGPLFDVGDVLVRRFSQELERRRPRLWTLAPATGTRLDGIRTLASANQFRAFEPSVYSFEKSGSG